MWKFVKKLLKVWTAWSAAVLQVWTGWRAVELEFLILGSLALQVFLILFANHRKRMVSKRLSLLLWSAYLLVDKFANNTLGFLANSQNCNIPNRLINRRNDQLLALWSSFVFLHLGGPDTITSFSLEDNQRWRRKLDGLFHFTWVVLIIIKSLGMGLRVPATIVFMAGLLKFAERTLALAFASKEGQTYLMVRLPERGPRPVKFVEKFVACNSAMEESHEELANPGDVEERPIERPIDYFTVGREAYRFFLTFKRLLVHLFLSFDDWTKSQGFFLRCTPKQAFKVIELELAFMYEMLYTKAALIHTSWGRLIRLITFTIILSVLLIFFNTKKDGYWRMDVIITYVLLVGTLAIETYAIGLMFLSFRMVIHLQSCKYGRRLGNIIFAIVKRIQPESRSRWSNSMAQYNLISLCHRDRPTRWRKILSCLSVKESWDQMLYTTRTDVPDELKELIFSELKSKVGSTNNPADYKEIANYRGEWTLRRQIDNPEMLQTVQGEFDGSILMWHIATDLCYHRESVQVQKEQAQMSYEISNYMLYFLVMYPSMLPNSIAEIRFGDACATVKRIIEQRMETLTTEYNRNRAFDMFLNVKVHYQFDGEQGNKSTSVFFEACGLAKGLFNINPSEERWQVISAVWVEMLCYAANNCTVRFHCEHLPNGGELLTIVWLLMRQLGIGEECAIEE